jgi:ATPase subunit of ABC transporter with duplicated ATPase domains
MDISSSQLILGARNIPMTQNEKNALKSRRWREKHPEKFRASIARYNTKNRELILERRRQRYKENPEKDRERCREWHKRNPRYNSAKIKEYRKKFPERYREYDRRRVRPAGQRNAALRKWSAKKQATDLNWRLTKNLRTRLWWALKKNTKSASTIALLGCNSIEDFKIYLETLFEVGMSWENYGNKVGQWSVDHILPCALFDLTKRQHQIRCFHFSNLRPMWHVDNLRKGAKTTTNK